MTNTILTLDANTITARDILALRNEALDAGDYLQGEICAVALAPFEHNNHDGSQLHDPDGTPTTRSAARQSCADIINAAAQE